ncbi:MAG: hypothetical protein RL625_306 [Gemmatimonadota bacterium]
MTAASPSPMRCRDATLADADAIAALYASFVRDTAVTLEETPPDAAEMGRRLAEVEAQGLPWLVAEDGAMVGYAYATPWRARRGYRKSVEITVYVAPTHHRRGVGRSLYTALFARLDAAGYHAALAGITLPNPASVALHEAMGMIQVAHFRETGCKFGRWFDVGYWERHLPGPPPHD